MLISIKKSRAIALNAAVMMNMAMLISSLQPSPLSHSNRGRVGQPIMQVTCYN